MQEVMAFLIKPSWASEYSSLTPSGQTASGRPIIEAAGSIKTGILFCFAGGDGLTVYHRLIPAAYAALTPGGFVTLEIGCGQSPAITELLATSGFEQIEFVPDLQGISRVACARRPS
jgi:hypothetical protein